MLRLMTQIDSKLAAQAREIQFLRQRWSSRETRKKRCVSSNIRWGSSVCPQRVDTHAHFLAFSDPKPVRASESLGLTAPKTFCTHTLSSHHTSYPPL
jgi:hypothetical protein